jgi:hypothetical protein
MKKWCFVSHAQKELDQVELPPIRLAAPQASALARLVPLLGCGEEAAALAFDGLAGSCGDDPATTLALRKIAAEERIHEQIMHGLAAALPEVAKQDDIMRAARRLHVQLGAGGARLHLAKIAALDAAVCTVLSRLLRPCGALSSDPEVHALLSRIRRDEARHVSLSRALVLSAGASVKLRDVGAAARRALANVLMLEASAFEALGVDPLELERDVAVLPNGLLAG